MLAQAYRRSINDQPSGWSGFGINYYDQDWNFIESAEKQIREGPEVSQNDFASSVERLSLGHRIPSNAYFAVTWIWNTSENTITIADNVGLYNYFPEGQFIFNSNAPVYHRYQLREYKYRNVVANGGFDFWAFADLSETQFYPDQDNGPEELFPSLDASSFWEIANPYNGSVVPKFDEDVVEIGNFESNASMAQQIELVPGEKYTFRTLAQPEIVFGDGRTLDKHFGTIGIDFFDKDWNEISEVVQKMNGPRLTEFVVPENTAHSFVWVWTPKATGNGEFTILNLRDVVIKRYQPKDLRPHVYMTGSPGVVTSRSGDAVQISLSAIAGSELRFTGGEVKIIGPNGVETARGIAGGNTGGGVWELNYYFPPGGSWGPEDNGTYQVKVCREYVTSDEGVNPQTTVGSFQVMIPND